MLAPLFRHPTWCAPVAPDWTHPACCDGACPEPVCALEPYSCNPVCRPSNNFTYHFSSKMRIVFCGLWHLACDKSSGLYSGSARFEYRLRHRLIRYSLWLFTGSPGYLSKCVKLDHALLFLYSFHSFLSVHSTLRSLMLNYRYTAAIQASTILPSSECRVSCVHHYFHDAVREGESECLSASERLHCCR